MTFARTTVMKSVCFRSTGGFPLVPHHLGIANYRVPPLCVLVHSIAVQRACDRGFARQINVLSRGNPIGISTEAVGWTQGINQ